LLVAVDDIAGEKLTGSFSGPSSRVVVMGTTIDKVGEEETGMTTIFGWAQIEIKIFGYTHEIKKKLKK